MFSERILIGNIFYKKRHFSKKYPLFLKTSYGKIHAVENERKDEEMKKFRFLVLSVCVALIICMAGGQLVMAEDVYKRQHRKRINFGGVIQGEPKNRRSRVKTAQIADI